MLIGYARVSTQDQKIQLQEDALEKEGCERIYKDVASGAQTDRMGLKEALSFCRKGDVLVVWKLDRLGRSIRHLIDTVNNLEEKGIGLKSLQENIDTTTSGGKLIFHLFGALAEFEREIIRERTQTGLKAARARGRQGGRPCLLDEKNLQRVLELYNKKDLSIAEICNILNVKRTTFYRYLKQAKIKNDTSKKNINI